MKPVTHNSVTKPVEQSLTASPPAPPPSPPSLSSLGFFAFDFIRPLRLFRAVGQVMLDGHLSFRAASEAIQLRNIPDIPEGITAISHLSDRLAPLFKRVFHDRTIQLFRLPTRSGWPVQGLSDDGYLAYGMTCEYLDEIDRSLGIAEG